MAADAAAGADVAGREGMESGARLSFVKAGKGAPIPLSDYGFPTFRCARPVTTEDVKALDEEE